MSRNHNSRFVLIRLMQTRRKHRPITRDILLIRLLDILRGIFNQWIHQSSSSISFHWSHYPKRFPPDFSPTLLTVQKIRWTTHTNKKYIRNDFLEFTSYSSVWLDLFWREKLEFFQLIKIFRVSVISRKSFSLERWMHYCLSRSINQSSVLLHLVLRCYSASRKKKETNDFFVNTAVQRKVHTNKKRWK